MVQLYDNETSARIGAITDAQFQFLQEHLEEESPQDTDYYLTTETLDLLEDEGIDAALLALLRSALGRREAMEIRWSHS